AGWSVTSPRPTREILSYPRGTKTGVRPGAPLGQPEDRQPEDEVSVSISEDVRAPQPRTVPSNPDGPLDRTPPQDLLAEQGVLGGMLLSKAAIADVVEILRSGDFYRPAHATIFDAVLDLYGRGEPADAITVAASLADAGTLGRINGAQYLHTLISTVPT